MIKQEPTTPIPLPAGDPAISSSNFAAPLPNSLGIQYVTQCPAQYLCWAACACMVLGVSQQEMCQLIANVLKANCCPNPINAGCDKPFDPQQVYADLNHPVSMAGSYLTEALVQEVIQERRQPVQMYLLLQNGQAAHTSLIVDVLPGTQGYRVYDPWWGGFSCSYCYLVKAYTLGRWTDTVIFGANNGES